MKPREIFIALTLVLLIAIPALAYFWDPAILWSFVVIGPLIAIGFYDLSQTKHTIRRNFPVLGNLRYAFESIRPEIMQYFVETDTEGRPISRVFRSMIYQRAKKVTDSTPFGTKYDVYKPGYEWLEHSVFAKNVIDLNDHPREMVGGSDCKQPYLANLLNISAMSFGSLSMNAVLAMSKAAKKGHFAHNTGEGGVSPYHVEGGGDLIWQIGTGYFGCRDQNGNFSEEKYKETSSIENVKMIELKISQGAKPGHGGILPGSKNTEEIAKIRGVEPHTTIHSPAAHTAFSNSTELMHFIKKLRDLSGGKPIGFKICVGSKQEFIDMCEAMVSTGIRPDFICVDGGEGGTGAAPIEFSNRIGMPLRDGLSFVKDTLDGYDLKKEIKLIAAGRIFSGFHIARAIALGADLCYSARAMMMAAGCIQALVCNKNTCPVGVATQDKSLMKGLDIADKRKRVAAYQKATVQSFIELLAAAGLQNQHQLKRSHIKHRLSLRNVLSYEEIYPYVKKGSYLNRTD